MSEQKTNFMHELDLWIDANVIGPLVVNGDPFEDEEDTQATIERVKKAIRTKVLESYRNGQGVKATPPARRQGGRYGR